MVGIIYNLRLKSCKGIDAEEKTIFPLTSGKRVEVVMENGVQVPRMIDSRTGQADKYNCVCLSKPGERNGKKVSGGMCMAIGEDKEDKWGYCPLVRAG